MSIPYQHHHHSAIAGPSSRPHGGGVDDTRKEKKRKEIAGKLGKEMNDRRDDYNGGRHYSEVVQSLTTTSQQLSNKPETNPLYNLRLLPITLERSALLSGIEFEEKHGLACAEIAYEEERKSVEEEYRKGRDRVRERLMEGIEERRRRAREEKDGEGTVGDATLDSQTRSHITRKLRNKLGTSPPPTPLGAGASGLTNGNNLGLGLPNSTNNPPLAAGQLLNPHSLSVDELPSPFPLPLTATSLGVNGAASSGGGGPTGPQGGRRRGAKGTGADRGRDIGGLPKSVAAIAACKEAETEHDLGEIRRGNKRRRAAVMAMGKTTT
ncbi:hypothetical protein HGRIS_004855 [Hohenbuehelia grisea]|uniref:Uncharacterized protein n=1 Tax=Hohenbuehelia grisea TaxID=104357 RepID=A0ABR3JDF1_9AGAR